MIGLILAIIVGVIQCIIVDRMADHLVKHLEKIEGRDEKMKQWVGIICVILIIGVFSFFALDEELGTTETTIESVTVTDTYTRHIKTKYTMVIKYYIVIETETGTKELSVQHSEYDKIEPKNEVRVEKTVTQTKWTHDTVVKYELA